VLVLCGTVKTLNPQCAANAAIPGMVRRDESDNRLENLEKAWKEFGKLDRSQCKANLQAVWHRHVLCGFSRISKRKE
jgi:hypothetical protein